jgi:3-dehydroquinate dehydratase-2
VFSHDASALEISSRNARVQAMQDRWSMLRAGVAQLMIERVVDSAVDMAEVPGGGTGLLVRQYQGGAPIYKVDTGLVRLIGQLLAHEKQAAEELGQWAEKRDVSADATAAAIIVNLNLGRQRVVEEKARAMDFAIDFRQSNYEGDVVEACHEACSKAAGIVINPASLSFTSPSLVEALRAFAGPKIEVHITNIHARDELHRHSIISTVSKAVICGAGTYGYILGMQAAAHALGKLPGNLPTPIRVGPR